MSGAQTLNFALKMKSVLPLSNYLRVSLTLISELAFSYLFISTYLYLSLFLLIRFQ